ncbi:MAG: transporter [Bacteriovoracaceae bacterium]|nr:transporter [Bacteriovoracaceae bacterium]
MLNLAVVVAALGYFVDIFDLLLFGIVRVPSLKSIGIPDDQLLSVGLSLLNKQMFGVLIGGIFWGILGDRKGRVTVLFGSIFLYSIANLANAFVHSIDAYAFWRFVAGLGLAGELGLAITLVSEILPKEKRGFATTIVASFGVLGSVTAALAANYFSWRICYFFGGSLGLLLLVLRIKLREPGLFQEIKDQKVKRGHFQMLFTNASRFKKYISLILIGAPVWFVVGIVVSFAPEVGKALGINEGVVAGTAILFNYAGLAVGDLASGLASQLCRSRRKIIFIFLFQIVLFLGLLIYFPVKTVAFYYLMCFFLGCAIGYWAVLMTTSAEMFGTNLRSTVTTTIPNFIRGSLVPVAAVFEYLKGPFGIISSIVILGTCLLALAFLGTYFVPETYGKDLRFLEGD